MSFEPRANVSLQPYNTLGIDVQARWFADVVDEATLLAALDWARTRQLPLQLLGGGSNIVLTRDLDGLVLRMALRGVRVVEEDTDTALLEVAAGEPWPELVECSLALGLSGLENLSLIPGTAGAAPVQNVGAYGIEIADVLDSVTALHLPTGSRQQLSVADCQLAYRDSRFKREPGAWIILGVRFRLSKVFRPHLDYGGLRSHLAGQGIECPTALEVSRAVCAMRHSKLPDPRVLGSAGSFFKNPVIPTAAAQALGEQHPGLVTYAQPDGRVKLAAGWLIDQAGWRGYRQGDAGVHEQQALILVNHGRASGQEILALAERIRADVQRRFGVQLELEPVCF